MPGKIDASLNQKLQTVEWGKYRLGDLFEIQNTLSFNADKLVEGDSYDYVTRTSANQGILQTTGFVNEENLNSSGIWSLGLLQMDFFYRTKKWYAGQFVRKIIPTIQIPDGCIPFFTTVLNKQKPKLLSVLVRHVDSVFENALIQLPSRNGKIDFDLMANFISSLEVQHYSELEKYLLTANLKNTTLSDGEKLALSEFKNVRWCERRIGDLFTKIETKKLPYQADDLPKLAIGKYTLPCLTSSFKNQGLNYYAPRDGATILKDVISIPSNSDVYRAYFQSREFTVLSDAYAIRWRSNKTILSPKQYLFFVLCINKITDLPIYSYKNKLGGWNVVKEKYIQVPVKNNAIDFEFMENLISAVQKLAVKNVVAYTNSKLTEADNSSSN